MECFTEFYELLENLTQPTVIDEDDELGVKEGDFKINMLAGIEKILYYHSGRKRVFDNATTF